MYNMTFLYLTSCCTTFFHYVYFFFYLLSRGIFPLICLPDKLLVHHLNCYFGMTSWSSFLSIQSRVNLSVSKCNSDTYFCVFLFALAMLYYNCFFTCLTLVLTVYTGHTLYICICITSIYQNGCNKFLYIYNLVELK